MVGSNESSPPGGESVTVVLRRKAIRDSKNKGVDGGEQGIIARGGLQMNKLRGEKVTKKTGKHHYKP